MSASLFQPRLAELRAVTTLSAKEKLFRFNLRGNRPLGHRPGQFVEVSVPGIGEAPISVSSSSTRGPGFELGVRRVGNVTAALHRLEPGALVGIRGPYGNGFPLDELRGRDLLGVAGGIGLFPLRSLIQYAVDHRAEFNRIIILYGCREPVDMLLRGEVGEWRRRPDMELLETVDRCRSEDAWSGNIGVITTLFPKIKLDPARTSAVIVGPPVMYRFVVAECLRKGLAAERIFMSLERRMKCGLGLCGHCQMGGTYVCLEGPVFRYAELTKQREAEI